MSSQEIDNYLAALDEPKRSTLTALRASILLCLPDSAQVISYGMPAFRVDGKVIAGFAAFAKHLAYLPHSGSVFGQLEEELADYRKTTGSLHFSVDAPLPQELVDKLIAVRMDQALSRRRGLDRLDPPNRLPARETTSAASSR
jgi:uncharacterized protein YdhG (YjbR/CyaY superfamily)